jgi:hypothetical protein
MWLQKPEPGLKESSREKETCTFKILLNHLL